MFKKRGQMNRFVYGLGIALIVGVLLTGCSRQKNVVNESKNSMESSSQTEAKAADELALLKPVKINDNYGTYYEVFLYSYYDSNGDGIGDINGLINKLDYLNDGDPNTTTDLGVNGIWLMPIMPSDSYHKYDVKDYYNIDPQYGTLDDFKHLIEECNKRDIKVILDLVINHTSDQNAWFQSAVKSLSIEPCGQKKCVHKELCREHNPYVKYYNFIEGKSAKKNFYSTGVGDWYYEGEFSPNMPDLNLDNKDLRKDLVDIMSYWLDMGVHGFRLDAALHYFSGNTSKNNEVLSWLNTFVKNKKKDSYLVAEVWTNLAQYSQYYESGIDSVFDFEFATESGIIAKTINRRESSSPGSYFAKALVKAQESINKYGAQSIDAPFFTNHDTARAYGYFAGNLSKLKLAAGINLTMTGNSFVYYGEEIGMTGSRKDEDKRAPMYWSGTDSTGITKGPAGMDEPYYPLGSVEDQVKDKASLYNYYKKAIALRNAIPGIARGEVEIVPSLTDNDVSALTKKYKESKILLLYNFSEETKQIDVKSVNFKELMGVLDAGTVKTELQDGVVTLQPYSIAILK